MSLPERQFSPFGSPVFRSASGRAGALRRFHRFACYEFGDDFTSRFADHVLRLRDMIEVGTASETDAIAVLRSLFFGKLTFELVLYLLLVYVHDNMDAPYFSSLPLPFQNFVLWLKAKNPSIIESQLVVPGSDVYDSSLKFEDFVW